jgi:multiple antibiotic resistance protein
VLLFVIALVDLSTFEKKRMQPSADSVGPVPLGTPLMVGPAVLTTSLMLLNVHGMLTTIAAIVVNIAIAGLVFYASALLTRVLGLAGTRALSKIASLFLAAIAVMMVRKGVFEIASRFAH